MNTTRHTRRDFVRRSLRLTAGAATLASVLPAVHRSRAAEGEAPRRHAIRLGAPIFAKTHDPEELAQAHRALGYRGAYCPDVSVNDTDRIRAIEAAFARHDVVIGEVGRWCNLLEADPEKRRQNLAKVTEGLALADAVGARCCVDIAGSFNPTVWYGPHPDNLSPRFFDAAVENARKIIDAVKPRRAKFCYEMMGWALPDSPESNLKLLQAVDRPAFAVHLDPCNLINSPTHFYRNTDLINACFDQLGPHIVSCHAKDLEWVVEMNIHFREVIPGKGELDYATFLRRLAELPGQPPLLLEHLSTAEEYQAGARHIVEVGRQQGLSFE